MIASAVFECWSFAFWTKLLPHAFLAILSFLANVAVWMPWLTIFAESVLACSILATEFVDVIWVDFENFVRMIWAECVQKFRLCSNCVLIDWLQPSWRQWTQIVIVVDQWRNHLAKRNLRPALKPIFCFFAVDWWNDWWLEIDFFKGQLIDLAICEEGLGGNLKRWNKTITAHLIRVCFAVLIIDCDWIVC